VYGILETSKVNEKINKNNRYYEITYSKNIFKYVQQTLLSCTTLNISTASTVK
jgi:hypothetical protein